MLNRAFLFQRFVWSFVVVFVGKTVEGALLSCQVVRRWTGGLCLEIAMDALVSTIVLWMRRQVAFESDAET